MGSASDLPPFCAFPLCSVCHSPRCPLSPPRSRPNCCSGVFPQLGTTWTAPSPPPRTYSGFGPAPPLCSDSSDPASFLLSSPDGTDIKSWSGVSQPIPTCATRAMTCALCPVMLSLCILLLWRQLGWRLFCRMFRLDCFRFTELVEGFVFRKFGCSGQTGGR